MAQPTPRIMRVIIFCTRWQAPKPLPAIFTLRNRQILTMYNNGRNFLDNSYGPKPEPNFLQKTISVRFRNFDPHGWKPCLAKGPEFG